MTNAAKHHRGSVIQREQDGEQDGHEALETTTTNSQRCQEGRFKDNR